MREVDELLRRRPGLGTLAGQAQVLRARLSQDRGSSAPGASALTAAELRLLPLLSTHLSFPEIAGEMFLSRNTIKSQAISIYRKLGAPPAARRSPGPVSWGSWRGDDPVFHPVGGMTLAPAPGGMVLGGGRRRYGPDGDIPGDVAEAGDDR
jgi:DNA-binding CsgD family transcriptional regulator